MDSVISFICNICGTFVEDCPKSKIRRELSSCSQCYSTVRLRSVVHAVSSCVYKKSIMLLDFPIRKDIRGIGLSDSHIYADPLSQKFDYVNKFYHMEPFLDITNPPQDEWEKYNFIISSEIFEHVEYPVSRAFSGARKLLQKGGALILTVPYGLQPDTHEYFTRLHRYKIVEIDGSYVLVNKLPSGLFELYQGLVFHGGPGQTLEMRYFSQSDLIRQLYKAGFMKVSFLREPVPEYGIFQEHEWDAPIIATVGY